MTALSVKLYDRSPYFVLFFSSFLSLLSLFFSLERNSPTSFDIEKKGRRAPGHYSWLIFHRGNPRYLIFDISRSRIERIGLRLSPVSYSLRAFVFDARRYFFCWRSFHETTQGARCRYDLQWRFLLSGRDIFAREREIERKKWGRKSRWCSSWNSSCARASFRVAGRAEEVLYIGAKGWLLSSSLSQKHSLLPAIRTN